MTVYAMAQFTIHDRAQYDRYAARFMEAMEGHTGRLLAANEGPQLVEGTWKGDKVVLIAFPDEAAFHAWKDSPLYREISKDHEAATEGSVLLLTGLG